MPICGAEIWLYGGPSSTALDLIFTTTRPLLACLTFCSTYKVLTLTLVDHVEKKSTYLGGVERVK